MHDGPKLCEQADFAACIPVVIPSVARAPIPLAGLRKKRFQLAKQASCDPYELFRCFGIFARVSHVG
jgi:hypothetical protein